MNVLWAWELLQDKGNEGFSAVGIEIREEVEEEDNDDSDDDEDITIEVIVSGFVARASLEPSLA